jgi:hypothetical protein
MVALRDMPRLLASLRAFDDLAKASPLERLD